MVLKPWGEISATTIRDLNNFPKNSRAFLNNFHGKRIRYLAKNFSSRRFLNSYARKILFPFLLVVVILDTLVDLVFCLCCSFQSLAIAF